MLAPATAALQAAARNSLVVACRSWALRLTRSGSATTTSAVSPTSSSTGTMRSTSTGASDSMPSTAIPAASLVEHVGDPGQLLGQRGGAVADLVGQQDLAARRCPQPVGRHLEAALVGDREPPDLLDGVTPELDPQRMVVGGREHVEDPAAHGELAAPLDHVGARVGRVHQRLDDGLEVGILTSAQRDRGELAQAGDHRLEERPDRHHDHPQRATGALGVRVGEPAEHGQPTRHGVAAGRETLVRERLPRRQDGDRVGVLGA